MYTKTIIQIFHIIPLAFQKGETYGFHTAKPVGGEDL